MACLFAVPSITIAGIDYFRVASLGSLRFSNLPGSYRDYRLNDNGQVVGKTTGTVSDQAAVWQNGVVVGQGYWGTGATFSEGHAINNSGAIATYGNDLFGNFFAARKFNSNWVSCLYPTGYTFASATGIADSGFVVGWAKQTGFLYGRAFYAIMDGNTRPTLLSNLGTNVYSMAIAINESGTRIVGYTFTGASAPTAVVWATSGAVQRIGTSSQSVAEDINNSTIAVGYDGTRAVAFDSSGTVDLTAGVACAINNANHIVGNTEQTVTASESLAWFRPAPGTTVYSLTALQTSSRTLYTASDINSKLQIVGQSSSGPYIATPVSYRSAGGAWNSPTSWQWGIQPSSISPVILSASSPTTISGPTTGTTIAELTVGSNALLNLASGQTLSIQGNSFGNGTATVAANGTLLVNGQINAPVVVAGVLAGFGTVNGNVTVQSNGIVLPGTSPGKLNVNGDLSLASGSFVAFEINGIAPGSQYDQIQTTGAVSVSNAIFVLSSGFLPTVGDTFVVFNNTGTSAINGTFSGMPEGSIFINGGFRFQISYQGGTGNDLVLTALSALTPIEIWRHSNFGTDANVGAAADEADSDGDTLPNLLEYKFGTSPTASNPVTTPIARNETEMTLDYITSDAANDATVAVESNTDLGNTWTSDGISYELLSSAGGRTTWRAHIPCPNSYPQRFARVRVTRP